MTTSHPTQAAGHTPGRWFFYVYQDGMRVASGDCPSEASARDQASHYAMQYAQDGPVRVVVRASRAKCSYPFSACNSAHNHARECPTHGELLEQHATLLRERDELRKALERLQSACDGIRDTSHESAEWSTARDAYTEARLAARAALSQVKP